MSAASQPSTKSPTRDFLDSPLARIFQILSGHLDGVPSDDELEPSPELDPIDDCKALLDALPQGGELVLVAGAVGDTATMDAPTAGDAAAIDAPTAGNANANAPAAGDEAMNVPAERSAAHAPVEGPRQRVVRRQRRHDQQCNLPTGLTTTARARQSGKSKRNKDKVCSFPY